MLKRRLLLGLMIGGLVSGRAWAQDDFANDPTAPIESEAPDSLEPIPDAESSEPAPMPEAKSPTEPIDDVDDAVATPPPDRMPNAAEEEPRAPIVREEEHASSSRGEPIFDWSKHRGEREVAHPFAEKGLIRIDKDRVYHYRVEETTTNRAIDLHFGTLNPENLSNPDDDGPEATYEENYNGAAPTLMANYEWQKYNIGIGRLGLRAGSGLFFSQGNGHFVHPNGLKPLEVFTFVAIPLNLGVVYRMQWWHRQLFVPYAEGGGTLWAMAETRDDGKSPKFGGTASAYFAAGAAMNLTYFNALSRISLEREYGVHAVFLLAEYRRVQGLSPRFDLSAHYLNGGLLMEF